MYSIYSWDCEGCGWFKERKILEAKIKFVNMKLNWRLTLSPPCDVSMIYTLFTGQLRNLLRDCNQIKFDFNGVISLMWETLLLCNYWKSVKSEFIEAQQFQALSNIYHQHWNTLRCDGSQSRELLYLVLLSVSLMKWWKAQNFVLQKFIVVTPWHLGMCWWIIRIDWGIL